MTKALKISALICGALVLFGGLYYTLTEDALIGAIAMTFTTAFIVAVLLQKSPK